MQFAGQRVDMRFKPLGEPHNYLIKMTDDILPDPDAVLITGITPQVTIAEGITEVAFLKIFTEEISIPGTIFVGFNSIRFDDEFMRFLHYRNFYDAYEWHWVDGRGRWDMLDVVRMTRALRPDGIKWPVDSKGIPANQLTMLTSINGLDHKNAHDALSDVQATIALAQLLRETQPKLFDYLLEMRDKKKVAELALAREPFVYTSGKYSSEHEKTTVVVTVTEHPKKAGAVVYDLRHDPTPYLNMKPEQLAKIWHHYCKDHPCKHDRLPVKTLQFNRCPAVAPLGVFNNDSQKRLQLSLKTVQKHLKLLKQSTTFAQNLIKTIDLLDKEQQARLIYDELDADAKLYDSFIDNSDKAGLKKVREVAQDDLHKLKPDFKDERLNALLPLYKARNFPKVLRDDEREAWERFRERRLLGGKKDSRAARFFNRLAELAANPKLIGQQQYLLEELQLYGQSILPTEPE